MKPEIKVSERKIKIVKEISELIKNKRTVLIASIKNLPASQFQEISKKLRGKANVKVPKKNLMLRAIDNSDNEKFKEIKKYVDESIAILFSDLDSFELASELIESKSPAKAKAGQEAPEDITVDEGPTELLPGPAISEFGSLGIQIQIEKGKITIKKPKVIVKKGEKISESAASIMNKLDIRPFSVGFIPLIAYDTKEEKLYSNININKEEAINEIKNLFGKALAFAVEIKYFSEETIKFLIVKASRNEKALENLLDKNPEKETEKMEEKKEEISEEKKADVTEESLKWALVNQGYSRTDIASAIEQVHKELAEKAPEIKEKPKIKYEIYDKDNKLIKVEVRRPFSIKKFFKDLFSS